MRGRIYIDCGCGLGSTSDREQPLSTGLIARNVLLIGLAGLMLLPVVERSLGAVDYLVVLAVLLAAMLLYAGAGQLIKNRAAIMTWKGR